MLPLFHFKNLSPKLRLLFVVLVGVAVLGLYQAYTSIYVPQHSTAAIGTSAIPAPDQDADHDGLTNLQESIWGTDYQNPDTDGDGFLDGEEVASGHNPTIPGPNDLLEGGVNNVTTHIGGVIFSGLYEGSLRPDSPTLDTSLGQIADDVIQQSEANLADITPNHITSVADTKENRAQYASAMSPLLTNIAQADSDGLQTLLKAYQNASDIIAVSKDTLPGIAQQQEAILDRQITQLENIAVPQNLAAHHGDLLTTLKKIRKSYEILQTINNDPLQGIVAFSNLITLVLQELPASMQSFIPTQ